MRFKEWWEKLKGWQKGLLVGVVFGIIEYILAFKGFELEIFTKINSFLTDPITRIIRSLACKSADIDFCFLALILSTFIVLVISYSCFGLFIGWLTDFIKK